MATQTDQERTAVIKYWMDYIKPREYPDLEDSPSNGHKIADYIEQNHGGVYSVQNISAAVKALQSNLLGLGVVSPEQTARRAKEAAAKAEAERIQKIAEHNAKVATEYLQNRAPSGLLVNGDFYPATQDKIIAFLQRNYPSQQITDAMLTEAITVMWSSLDWFDKSDAATQFRNVLPPPPRRLSHQARIDAGLELPEDLRSHTKDSALKNPAEQMRKIVKKLTGGMEDPELLKADQISVTNRHGRVDHGFNAKLREIFARRGDGTVDGAETRRLRTAAADEYERRRNRG
jgi:hypothetical protein